jgi:hypothetical protein
MLSAVIPAERSQPAVHLAVQLAHQRFVRPGPLVLGTALLKSPTPTEDRDRTVSRMYFPHYCGHRLYLHPISGGRRVMDRIDLPNGRAIHLPDRARSRKSLRGPTNPCYADDARHLRRRSASFSNSLGSQRRPPDAPLVGTPGRSSEARAAAAARAHGVRALA